MTQRHRDEPPLTIVRFLFALCLGGLVGSLMAHLTLWLRDLFN